MWTDNNMKKLLLILAIALSFSAHGQIKDGAGQLQGTRTNDNACAGCVGEYVDSAFNTNAAASNTYQDVTTLSVTAGDWDCSVTAVMGSITAANTSNILLGISIGTAGNTFSDAAGGNQIYAAATNFGSQTDITMTIANFRVNVAATTTVRAKTRYIYSAGTPASYGRLLCRRVR